MATKSKLKISPAGPLKPCVGGWLAVFLLYQVYLPCFESFVMILRFSCSYVLFQTRLGSTLNQGRGLYFFFLCFMMRLVNVGVGRRVGNLFPPHGYLFNRHWWNI